LRTRDLYDFLDLRDRRREDPGRPALFYQLKMQDRLC
jgi:hypothetical protein